MALFQFQIRDALKAVRNEATILAELPRIMARYGAGEQEFIYVADSALATKDNLSLMKDVIHFITRLPENFGACGELISTSVAATASWESVGQLSQRVFRIPSSSTSTSPISRPIPTFQ